eukprot:366054-Pleurochrysis_carterae.AAC.1
MTTRKRDAPACIAPSGPGSRRCTRALSPALLTTRLPHPQPFTSAHASAPFCQPSSARPSTEHATPSSISAAARAATPTAPAACSSAASLRSSMSYARAPGIPVTPAACLPASKKDSATLRAAAAL